MRFAGQHVMVLGLGKSGLGALHLLHRAGARLSAADSRPLAQLPAVQKLVENSEISYLLDSQASLAGIDILVISPGVPLSHPLAQSALAQSIPVIGEIELAYEFLRGPILAITGSNGKTTTVSLVGHILHTSGIAAQVGGNIGFPATDMVETSSFLQWNVLELSSFQLETVSQFRAQIAAILNITPNHLDRHGDFDRYAAAKGNIFRNQRSGDWAVLNAANAASAAFSGRLSSHAAHFNGEEACIRDGMIELRGQALLPVKEIPLPGTHNQENVMAAALMASLAGAPHAAIAAAITTFAGVRHRLEFIREHRGIRFYNDSKATSVDATLKAIEALPGPLWVILGGTDKGASYTPLAAPLRAKAKGALLIGASTPLIERDLKDLVALTPCGDLAHALDYAVSHAAPGDTVLLAPACASFDQFQSFEHRGDTFRQLVEAL